MLASGYSEYKEDVFLLLTSALPSGKIKAFAAAYSATEVVR